MLKKKSLQNRILEKIINNVQFLNMWVDNDLTERKYLHS